jgi:hypothetical protein
MTDYRVNLLGVFLLLVALTIAWKLLGWVLGVIYLLIRSAATWIGSALEEASDRRTGRLR